MIKRTFVYLMLFLFVTSSMGMAAADNPGMLSRLELVGPNGGEVFTPGAIYQLKWNYSGQTGNRIRINLLKQGKFFQEISPAVPIGVNGTGVFKWPIANQIEQSNQYRIELQSVDYPGVKDQSDGDFAIRGLLELKKPQAGTFVKDTGLTISWHAAGAGPTIRILLLRNGMVIKTIAASVPASKQEYLWDAKADPGKNYKIRIISNNQPQLVDESDNTFELK